MTETLSERFDQYHKENPHVFTLLVEYTGLLKDNGFQHYGIGAVFERIRWETDVVVKDPEGFKLNNNYRSRYVRLLEEKHPELTGFYHKRELTSK